MYKTRKCPNCFHNKSKVLFIQKFSAHFEHKIVSCLFCGFIYVNKIPSQKYYNNYYKNQTKYNGTRQHEIHEEYTYKKLDIILKKFFKKNAKILDVGCSTGNLLNFIKNKGYKNILGIEPAPECKLIAKKKYNIVVKTETLDSFKTRERYDLIIFSQVFEHLADLRKSILKSHNLLKDNGMIFISVPDAESFVEEFEEPYGEFSTEHINFFTKKSLTQLLQDFSKIYINSDSKIIVSLFIKINNNQPKFNEYINKSKYMMENIKKVINSLPKDTTIWGVGALTQKLLKTTNLKTKIFKFVDNNTNLIGRKIEGIEIASPLVLKKINNPILISSFRFKNEILSFLKKNNIKNQIITF